MNAAARLLWTALVCALPMAGFAQSAAPPDSAASAETPAKVSKFRDPQDGQIDLSSFLATPRRFLPIPLVVTEPAVGYGGGLAAMFVRPRKDAGSEGYARPNMSIVGGIAT